MSRISMTEMCPQNSALISALEGKHLNLYKMLDHQPKLLKAWLEFAYSLRNDCNTPRELREMMILRGAQIMRSEYEWFQHLQMAKKLGVSDEKINELENWSASKLFSQRERSGLKLMEAIMVGTVDDALADEVKTHFTESEFVELVMTGSFYAMVPRVLDALQVPVEIDELK